jgi:predicted solute-binding protein
MSTEDREIKTEDGKKKKYRADYYREWRARPGNKEKIKEYNRRWAEKHTPEERREYNRKTAKFFREKNREKYREYIREYIRKYKENPENLERIRNISRAFYEKKKKEKMLVNETFN